jgi:hypothetical protein
MLESVPNIEKVWENISKVKKYERVWKKLKKYEKVGNTFCEEDIFLMCCTNF